MFSQFDSNNGINSSSNNNNNNIFNNNINSNNGLNRVEVKIQIDQAKRIAQKILDTYDTTRRGYLNKYQCSNILNFGYSAMNRAPSSNMSQTDVFFKVLDNNQDGIVTLEDLEKLCFQYLVPNINVSPATSFNFTSYNNYSNPNLNTNSNSFNNKVPVLPELRKSYGPEIDAKLDVARQLFQMFDKDNSGYLQENEIGAVLTKTYEQMNVYNFRPTSEDIQFWMELVDQDRDGRVSIEEYETMVLRSLIQAGFEIDTRGSHSYVKF